MNIAPLLEWQQRYSRGFTTTLQHSNFYSKIIGQTITFEGRLQNVSIGDNGYELMVEFSYGKIDKSGKLKEVHTTKWVVKVLARADVLGNDMALKLNSNTAVEVSGKLTEVKDSYRDNVYEATIQLLSLKTISTVAAETQLRKLYDECNIQRIGIEKAAMNNEIITTAVALSIGFGFFGGIAGLIWSSIKGYNLTDTVLEGIGISLIPVVVIVIIMKAFASS